MRYNDKNLNPMLMRGPIRDHDLPKSRINELLALDALKAGTAVAFDVQTMRTAVALARALGGLGYAADELGTVKRAGAVLRECSTQPPGSIGLRCVDLAAVRELVLLLDQQRAACGFADYARALLAVGREARR